MKHEDLQEIINRDYISVGEAARILQINRATVRYSVQKGKLRALKLNVIKKGVQYLNLIKREDLAHYKPKPYGHFRARIMKVAR